MSVPVHVHTELQPPRLRSETYGIDIFKTAQSGCYTAPPKAYLVSCPFPLCLSSCPTHHTL
ncbi:hypothetical protein EYF80_052193 [Liparis tanakae]|uniref:Uncharacterized protein n=1 Tax=Liparis tanakae TaxID=230148 RepID=A0A4Z2F8S5_9TELE|nr:hypothetical protein EYF80_052193 [Liparis tanakae]